MRVSEDTLFYAPMNQLILSTAYLGPVQYYTKFFEYNQVEIERYDSYRKQSYRNRCRILGANGPLSLSVPVIKNSGEKTRVKDVMIDYATRWQNNHWRSIFSAYNSSPFFEYYEPDFMPFYEKKWKYLFDFNLALHHMIAEILELENTWQLSNEFKKVFNGDDYRELISPKIAFSLVDKRFKPIPYRQTFDNKYGFQSNLSIIDLIFNCGPEAALILEKSFATI